MTKKLKEYYTQITANKEQITADFVKNTMHIIKDLLETMKEGTEYEGYIDFDEEPDRSGLFLIGDLLKKEGIKYALIIDNEVNSEKEIVETSYSLMISLAHYGE